MSAPAPQERTRRAARRMVDEDEPALAPLARLKEVGRDEARDGTAKRRRTSAAPGKAAGQTARQAPPTPPSSAPRRRPAALASSSNTSPSSPKLLVKLDGRVYRPPSPGDPRTKLEFEADLLLAGPPETIEDLERTRRDKRRREVEDEMRRERAREAAAAAETSGAKGKGRLLTFDDSDDELDVVRPRPATPSRARTARGAITPPPAPAFPAGAASPSPSLGFPFALQPSRRASAPLPAHLASLLSLHSAVERALILHLSTAGSALASTQSGVSPEAGTATVKMANLVDLPTLSRMLESTGKRFGEDELRRLVWAWQGAGAGAERVVPSGGDDEVGGMGFVVTRARTAAAPGRVAQTYGLGISVALRANPQLPKFELVSPGRDARRDAPPSPSSVGKGREGMSIVALWTQGKEDRRKEMEKRLRAWSERQVKREEELDDDGDLTFASVTTTSGIPLAALPLLAPAVTAIPSTSTPSPTKRLSTPARAPLGADLPVASPSAFVGALLQGKPVVNNKGTSAADRARARRERIQAKQQAQQQSAYHSSFSALSTGESSPSKRSLKRHGDALSPESGGDALTAFEQHKRNAMLSRLGSVADVLSLRCAGRPTPLEEVCNAVANSPLLAIGHDEASQAISFLAGQFPDFCYLKLVGQEHWVYLRGAQRAVEVKERVREELARAQEAQKA
ncbi:hypothetical protein JCM10449v2_004186 [Rhodotorula kratochvilovae]